MVSPPTPTGRRALFALVWLAAALAGLIGAVWAVGWAVQGGPQPSAASVGQAVHLEFPDGTDVVDADLAQMSSPNPGDRAEVTVDIPADDFAAFLDANAMATPLVAGLSPAGTATGTIPAGCTADVCYAASLVIDEDTVTVDLTVTLL
jgi:hypothetical protein